MNGARILVVLSILAATPADAQCRLCAPAPQSGQSAQSPAGGTVAPRALTIEVATALDLGRAATTAGGGSITIDERSGARAVSGLRDLGGQTITGTVRLSGEPLRRVRVTMPTAIRLAAPGGGQAEAVDLRTDLPADPVLDAGGMLTFAFGARLVVHGDASGDFRGRIPITAEYE